MAIKSFTIKTGKMRFYSGQTPPYFFEVPFRGAITAPVDRPRSQEVIAMDRGVFNQYAHYVSAADDPLLAPLTFSCQARLTNVEPNYSKILTVVRSIGGITNPIQKTIANRAWVTAKGSTQILNGDPEGAVLFTTPTFGDPEKWCVNIEVLWLDSDGTRDRGFRWGEVYFPPDRQVTEGETELMLDLTGEIYGAITPITQFTVGVEA